MSKMNWRILAGGGLILMGMIALLDVVFQIELSGLLWSFLFLLGGAAFLAVLVNDRKQWWAAIPGFTLLGIGALIGFGRIAPTISEQIGGAFVLGGIGISFIVVYLLNRHFWWALIPAGVMASLVVMLVIEPILGDSAAWVFLLGLGGHLRYGVLAARAGWRTDDLGTLAGRGDGDPFPDCDGCQCAVGGLFDPGIDDCGGNCVVCARFAAWLGRVK